MADNVAVLPEAEGIAFCFGISEEWMMQGWTLEEVAAHTGLHVNTLRAVSEGRTNPTKRTILLLCQFLHVHVLDMIKTGGEE